MGSIRRAHSTNDGIYTDDSTDDGNGDAIYAGSTGSDDADAAGPHAGWRWTRTGTGPRTGSIWRTSGDGSARYEWIWCLICLMEDVCRYRFLA